MSNPSKGFRAKHYYVAETTANTTPTSPAWTPFKMTSGTPSATADPSISAELDGLRDVTDHKNGTFTPTFECAVELTAGAHSDLIQAALGGTIATTSDGSGLSITVDATAKTFTRASGSFTSKTEVGGVVYFPSLTGDNKGPWRVKAVTATVITVDDSRGLMADETSVTTDAKYSQKTEIGFTRRTFSVLSHNPDADNGNGEYSLTTGVEVLGFNLDFSPNARVTGTFNMSGRGYTPDAALPAGSTFNSAITTSAFHYVEGYAYVDGASSKFQSMTFTNDNGMSAQTELGCGDEPSFYEQDRANNTIELTGFFRDHSFVTAFKNGTDARVSMFLTDTSGNGFNIEMPLVKYTAGAPEVGGTTSITQTISGQVRGTHAGASSVTIQELIA